VLHLSSLELLIACEHRNTIDEAHETRMNFGPPRSLLWGNSHYNSGPSFTGKTSLKSARTNAAMLRRLHSGAKIREGRES
jgi:hypothetical protein